MGVTAKGLFREKNAKEAQAAEVRATTSAEKAAERQRKKEEKDKKVLKSLLEKYGPQDSRSVPRLPGKTRSRKDFGVNLTDKKDND